MPPILDASLVISSSLAGSFGAGIAVESLSNWMARAVSGDICWPSNFLACSIHTFSCDR